MTSSLLRKAPKYRFAVFVLLMFPYILVYVGIQIISSVGPDIMSTLSVGESKLSLLSSLGSLSKAFLAVVSGALAGRIGGKKVVVGGLCIMAISGVLYMLGARSFPILCVVRLVQGAGSGLTSGCLTALLSAWFPKKERGTAQGAMSCFFGGSVSIATVYAYACETVGMAWNMTIGIMLLAVGAVMAIMMAVFYKDVKTVYGVSFIDEVMGGSDCAEEKKTAREGMPSTWREIFRFPGFWITGTMEFFYCASCFGAGFIMPLFITSCGFEGATAASIMTVGTLSSIATSFIGGVMSDRLFKARRSEMVILGYGGAAVLFLAIALLGRSMSAAVLTAVYFLAYGALMLASSPAWVIPVEIVAPKFAPQSLGTCITFSGIGGFCATYALGGFTEKIGIGAGMLVLVVCMTIVALCAFVMKKKYRA